MFCETLLVAVTMSWVSAAPNINVVRLMYNKLDEAPVVSPFIVGGKDTNATDHPYLTGVLANFCPIGTTLCGGAVIHSNWVLTAAHCFYYGSQFAVKSVSVRVGNVNYLSTEIYHVGYSPSSYLHDIAIVKVTPSITLVKPILLPPQGSRPPVGAIIYITQAAIVIDCKGIYGSITQDSIFCVSGEGSGLGNCQVASGSPAVYPPIENCTVLAGIAVVGYTCAGDGPAGLYTNVGSYSDIFKYIIQNL